MRLEPRKIEWLLEALGETDCPMSCPHGRPVALRYPTKDNPPQLPPNLGASLPPPGGAYVKQK